MFKSIIAASTVLFAKFFNERDAQEAVAGILGETPKKVVFLDTPPAAGLAVAIRSLLAVGVEVVVRDHHDSEDSAVAKGGRAAEIRTAADEVRGLIGSNAIISNRRLNPACSSLLQAGEFCEEGTVIVADSDCDGLTAAMKAAGCIYPTLDADAAILDGERKLQTLEGGLSPLAVLLVKGMATLPPFNAQNPAASEKAKGELFTSFAKAASGDESALKSLEGKVATYEAAVAVAKELASKATEPVKGLVMVDIRGASPDLATLTAALEKRAGVKITVNLKGDGPIAPLHGGLQYSMAVVKEAQVSEANPSGIDLRQLLPQGQESSPKAGIISNTSFLLHCSEAKWNEVVLPGLKALLEQ